MRKWTGRGLTAISTAAILSAVCGLQACGADEAGPAALRGSGHRGPSGFVLDVDPATGSADLMVAVTPLPPTVENGDYEAAARDFIDQRKDALKLTNPRSELALVEIARAGDGTAHVSFAQRENGVVVDGVVIAVHFRRDGSVAMLTGPASPDAAKTSVTPAVAAQGAVTAAESDLKAAMPAYDASKLASPPSPRLVLVPEGASARLAWKLDLRGAAGGTFANTYYVDAQTGGVMRRISRIQALEGSGAGVLGDTKTFNIRELPGPTGKYAMYQGGIPGEGGRERVVTYAWTGEETPDVMVRSNDPDSWDVVQVGAGSAVDAHRYAADTASWFRSTVGFASFDGRGAPLRLLVHDDRSFGEVDGKPVTNAKNAFWDGEGTLHFGDGDLHEGGDVQPLACGLDIIAHELMHGVTQHTSGLVYEGQSGALNEALSDIFGIFVEQAYAPPGSDLTLIGEAAFPGGLRDVVHPATKEQPDHVKNMETGDRDHGGVHINSGIVNNAWYLMTFGGTNDTSQMAVTSALGMDASRQLWWHTSRHLLRPDSTFERAARQQTGWAKVKGFPLEAVACAWVATGVLKDEYVKSTYGVECGAAAAEDAGAPPPEQDGPEPTTFDSCKGRADGVYCSQREEYSAIVCEGGTIVSGQQCAGGARCLGPNGAGSRVQCEGDGTAPPPPPPDDNAPMTADSCDGKADGVYCSSLAPFSAYVCQGGSIAGGQQCPNDASCVGPNGAGDLECR
jgi:thermolysin